MVDTPGRFFRVDKEFKEKGVRDSESDEDTPLRAESRESNSLALPKRLTSRTSLVSQISAQSVESECLTRSNLSKPKIKIVETAGSFFRKSGGAIREKFSSGTGHSSGGSGPGTPRRDGFDVAEIEEFRKSAQK